MPIFANAYAFLYTSGRMQDLGGLFGSSDSLAFRVNDFAQCVGNSITVSGFDQPRHATLWDNGSVIDLGTLGGFNSWAYDINESGQVAGFSDTADNTAHHSFIYDLETGDMADLGDFPGFPSNEATGLNNHGDVVGIAFGEFFGTAAFIYRDGVMSKPQPLLVPDSGWVFSGASDINDAGMIVGSGKHEGTRVPFS